MAQLSVIVPATNAPATLDECVDAVRRASAPGDELIVVSQPAGAGPARARNDGARRATREVLVFVDADVVVHRDALSRIRARFDTDADLAALFGSYDDDPAAAGLVSGFRNLLHHYVHHSDGGPASTFWAGLGAVRRSAFVDCGGFDERRYPRPSIEDIELGSRLTEAGAKIVLDPLILGKHLKEWSLREMVATDLVHRGIPWIELLLRQRRHSTALNLSWRHRLGTLGSLIFVVSATARRPAPAAGGLVLMLALNRRFYVLLMRRRGLSQALAGVALHLIHHLVGAVAVPAGLVKALFIRRRAPR